VDDISVGTDADWVAASKNLYDTKTKPALDRMTDMVFDLIDVRFQRVKLYDGDYVFGGDPKETEETKEEEGVIQRAEDTPGEDGGVSVPAAIVIGVLSTGAAAIGAAAAGSGDGKKNKSYKMYVQKDFGDAIWRGKEPVVVRARMAESEGGVERDRDDLTMMISAKGDGLTVHGTTVIGRYLEARVSAPADGRESDGKLIFAFNGEGGTFTNTVVFRLVDGPSIKFTEEDPPGSGRMVLHDNVVGIDAIPGDGFTYTEQFWIMDAMTQPAVSDITAENADGFSVTFEATQDPYLFKMHVKNDTPAEKNDDVFERPKDSRFVIRVRLKEEKEPLEGHVTVTLHPEGITVKSDMEGKKKEIKYVRVQAYEKEYAGDLDRKWQVSEIQMFLAVMGNDRAVIDPV
jgi:hypothetical protein